ncbi:MAG: flagellar biosynthetic protein FliR [Gammaproteobacteria bacterium]|nr:flagellar biosynthetic protein FliR [Gammaproteobacteria bacterium]
MGFTSAEITSLVGIYLWPLFRIGALVSAAPLLGSRSVPVRIRLGLALVLTLVIAPVLPPPPALDPFSAAGLQVTIAQVLIGLAMGFALQLVFAAFVLAGELISMGMGLGFAAMNDPVSGVSVPTIGQFYTIVVTLLFLALNGHLMLIEVLADSFHTLPVGTHGLAVQGVWELVLWGGRMFVWALLIALPAMGALLLVNLGFGIMTRAAPQLNIFAVGFMAIILLGLLIMYVTLPSLLPQLMSMMDEIFGLLRHLMTLRA